MTKKRLPQRLSALIELAVRDAQAVEQDPRYTLNMSQWHTPAPGACLVCMAGAVMAKTMGAPRNAHREPERYSPETRWALCAINDVRIGDVFGAIASGKYPLRLSKAKTAAATRAKGIIDEKLDPERGRAPWDTYLEAAKVLRKVGL